LCSCIDSASCILCFILIFPCCLCVKRQKLLWADDLSSYDSILELGFFNIPFYGDHVSLFPILASIAIFFYTQNDHWAATHASATGNAKYENNHVFDAFDDVVFL